MTAVNSQFQFRSLLLSAFGVLAISFTDLSVHSRPAVIEATPKDEQAEQLVAPLCGEAKTQINAHRDEHECNDSQEDNHASSATKQT